MPLILAIESTCDETAAALVRDGRVVLSNAIASQVELHARYRGVVPEIASRAHIENILPVLHESLATAGVSLEEIDAVAVAHRPGLIGSLLIGVTAAKTLVWTLGKPLIGVDHVHAHLYSVMLEGEKTEEKLPVAGCQLPEVTEYSSQKKNLFASDQRPATNNSLSSLATGNRQLATDSFPAIGLVCSGGHTALYHLKSWMDVTLIGTTLDDAVGEAYDKVATLLGQGYPGGPILDRLAREGDPRAIRFPRTLLGKDSFDFSFSGLKTAVLYHVKGVPTKAHGWPAEAPPLSEQALRDIAAGFQAACIDVLSTKLKRALARTGARSILIGGGVSANRGLRAALRRFPIPVYFPAFEYCTDNAAMSAGLASIYYQSRTFSPLTLDAITHSQFLD
jgi:N6-L-threonylcarbamoyladenine synthase